MNKVLFLTNIPSPYRVDFFNELGKHCQLTVLYERKDALDRNQEWLNRTGNNYKEVYLKGIKIGKDTALCYDVLKHIKKKKFDIIIVGGYSTPTGMIAIEYMRRNKIPYILNTDGGMIKNDSSFQFYVKTHFIRNARAWLSTSSITDNYLVHYGAEHKGIYRYPFTSLKEEELLLEPISREEKNTIKGNLKLKQEKIVVSVGRFIYSKGFDVLISAASKIGDNVGVYIIGGKPTAEYEHLINRMGISNVHFVDFVDKDQLKEYYMAADLFVLPTRGDVWGLVINEAMALGLPVITTDKCVAGLELIKESKNGYIVSSDDVDELVEKIQLIIHDDSLIKSMSLKSIEYISKYTIENMVRSHLVMFDEVSNQ